MIYFKYFFQISLKFKASKYLGVSPLFLVKVCIIIKDDLHLQRSNVLSIKAVSQSNLQIQFSRNEISTLYKHHLVSLSFKVAFVFLFWFLTERYSASASVLLNLAWNYYVTELLLSGVPEYVLNIYHKELILLPWGDFSPDITNLKSMVQVVSSYYPKKIINAVQSILLLKLNPC